MVDIPEHLHSHLTDSAGQPWQGRTFSDNPWSDDDGSAPAALLDALSRFRTGNASLLDVIAELRETRVLVPLVAALGEAGVNDAGQTVDKSAELSIVSVKAPDGRAILPIFSSVAAMQQWDSNSRPIPIDARKAALAAASEGTELCILDPGSETELVIRRPAVWAIAQGTEYQVPWQHPRVLEIAAGLLEAHSQLLAVELEAGDLPGRFIGPELVVQLAVPEDASDETVAEILAAVQQKLAGHQEELVQYVDSLALRVARTTQPDQPSILQQDAVPPRAGLFRRFRRR